MSGALPAYVHGFAFHGEAGEVTALLPEEVLPALKIVEERVASGLHAAGFVSYHAAGALNGELTTQTSPTFPLLWFGLFEERSAQPFPECGEPYQVWGWESSWSAEEFAGGVARIRDLIAAGDCYQVNLTMRERFSFSGSTRSFFNELSRRQPTPYSSYLEAGRFRILSASPELFFSLRDGTLTARPMKGTAARGGSRDEDRALKQTLRESPKELAENLMIVDLLRNDMGIVSETGSVRVTSLFDVETHPTLHQMTSTIESRLLPGVGTAELMRALFPCGSITGAPKRRCMEIIAELEPAPRGLYTGCIGYFSPGADAEFSVAIRTAVIDAACGRGEIGIGSGITYDSLADAEYRETMSKASFARNQESETANSLLDVPPPLAGGGQGVGEAANEVVNGASPPTPTLPRKGGGGDQRTMLPDFHLIESLLFEGGYFLPERHLERLARSAAYFGFPLEMEAAQDALAALAPTLAGKQKVRLLLFFDGRISCEAAPIAEPAPDAPVGFAEARVDSSEPFLYHKTSRRALYAQELARRPDLAEVIFLNERGEVTEGTSNNLVAVIGAEAYTPALESGLLPGTFREELLSKGVIRERILTPRDLEEAQEIYLINSVRKWRKVRLVQ